MLQPDGVSTAADAATAPVARPRQGQLTVQWDVDGRTGRLRFGAERMGRHHPSMSTSGYPRPRHRSSTVLGLPTPGDVPAPVVVVGAGPVGLTTALGLAGRGVPVMVLEVSASASFGSRAICLSRHTLEVFDRMGAGASFEATALPWSGGRSFYGAREILTFAMPHAEHDVRPPMVNLSQTEVEEFLLDALAQHPLATVHWGVSVVGVQQSDEAVTLTVDTADGRRELATSWTVAADGARSSVRDALGLSLSGTSYEGRYVIADIHWPSDLPTERLVWFDPPSNPGSTIIMHRQPHDIWRVDYQLGPDEHPEREAEPERIRDRIGRHLAWLGTSVPWTLEWSSTYRAHALSLTDYVHGRVLFAGDAAHLVPIFGVRGLNSGIEDAETLAWQLAAVVHGSADAGLLRAYSHERRTAWQQNIDAAGKSTRIMTPGSHGYSTSRDAVLALALDHPEFRPLVNPRQSSATHVRTSPLTWPAPDHASGIAPGDPVADRAITVWTPDGPVETSLNRVRGQGFGVLAIGVAAAALSPAVERLQARFPHESVQGIAVGPQVGASDDTVAVVADRDGALVAALGGQPGEVLVIRPDGLLLSRHRDATELDGVAAHLHEGTSPTGSSPESTDATRSDSVLELAWRTVSEALDSVEPADREGLLVRAMLLLVDGSPADSIERAISEAVRAAPTGRR